LHDGVNDTLVSDGRGEFDAEHGRPSHQIGQRKVSHLAQDPASMGSHDDLADTQLCCDLLVQQAREDQCQDLCSRGVSDA
jgi:hypothetical protein